MADDKKHIAVGEDHPTEYRSEALGASVRAFRFEHFVSEHVESSNFNLDDVDGSLLSLAAALFRRPSR